MISFVLGEVGAGLTAHFCHCKSLDSASMGNVGTETQVNKGSTAVHRG